MQIFRLDSCVFQFLLLYSTELPFSQLILWITWLMVALLFLLGYKEGTLRHWSMSREGQGRWWRVWNTNLMRNSWENWNCLAGINWGSGKILSLYNCLKSCTEVVGLFFQVKNNRRRGNAPRLNHWRFKLDSREKLFTERAVKHQEQVTQGRVTIHGSI